MVLDFFAGCLGGCAGLVIGYPLDTIKVHIQTQNNKNPQYRGTWHCFRSILAKESGEKDYDDPCVGLSPEPKARVTNTQFDMILFSSRDANTIFCHTCAVSSLLSHWKSELSAEVTGFYKGITSPLAGVAVINAIVFGVYGQTQKYFIQNSDNLSIHFLAGAAAGLAQSPVASPLELAKTRLQLQAPPNLNFPNGTLPTADNKISMFQPLVRETKLVKQYSSPLQCLCEIYRKKGITGIFSGLTVTVLREVPSYGLYFLTYEALIRLRDKSSASTFHMLIAGGLAGIVSWVFTYPIDVIKSRLQADHQGRYTGAIDCYRQSVVQEGYKCLFRGLNSTIIRAFPTNAITFTVVNWTYRLCGQAEEQINEMEHKLIKHEIANDSQLTSIVLYNHSDIHNNNNNINNNHSHYYHHCNSLLDNFNSLFNSIIDNAHNFKLYCQMTSGSRESD